MSDSIKVTPAVTTIPAMSILYNYINNMDIVGIVGGEHTTLLLADIFKGWLLSIPLCNKKE